MHVVFDIETDGLMDTVSKIHCVCLKNLDTGEVFKFGPTEVHLALSMCDSATRIIGHNILRYDLPVLEKVLGWVPKAAPFDTLVMARVMAPDVSDKDFRRKEYPKRLIGSHSLEAWGYRLGKLKGEYGQKEGAWDKFTPEMLEYCANDTEVTALLYETGIKLVTPESMELEHAFARIIYHQEVRGFAFDKAKAVELYTLLCKERVKVREELTRVFRPWYIPIKTFTPKVNNKKHGLRKGAEQTKIQLIYFNPSSRQHIADRLKELRGWEPGAFTEKGQPKVDETVLASLPYPEAPTLARHFLLDKRIGQLAEGKEAWLKCEKNGRIHGAVNTNGAVTGRCTHSRPNIAQVPAGRSDFGHECRSLFIPSFPYDLVGFDASGLELRCLAHYMAAYDDGAYGKILLDGDIHTANQEAAGLPTRDNAKTFIYAFLYGAGDAKIGSIVGKGARQGKRLRAAFLAKLPALAKLVESVKKAAKRGYLLGLDGRRLRIRSEHAALNTLLQSAGALAMKQALIILDGECKKQGWGPKEYGFVANIHDEAQAEVLPQLADQFGRMAVSSITMSGASFGFRCPLAGEYKIGRSWAETH